MGQTTTMTTAATGPAISPILARWNSFRKLPGGRLLFSLSVGRYVRYSGTVGARVQHLEPGRSVVTMRDRAAVRNHLRSVHACAQVTAGELASGLAMLAGMPPGMRAIVTGLEIRYDKKARGLITATGSAPIPVPGERSEYEVAATLTDESGDTVSAMTVRWLVGPSAPRPGGGAS